LQLFAKEIICRTVCKPIRGAKVTNTDSGILTYSAS